MSFITNTIKILLGINTLHGLNGSERPIIMIVVDIFHQLTSPAALPTSPAEHRAYPCRHGYYR